MVEDDGNNHQGSLLLSGELQLLCLGVRGEIELSTIYTLYFPCVTTGIDGVKC